MKHIVSFSGGKDSTAMLLQMIELKMPIDEIIYFDCGSWEFPQMERHIEKVQSCISKKITILKPKQSFDYLFSEHISKARKGGEHKGYGFPTMVYRWCTGRKNDALAKGIDRKNTIQYLGITIDELQRAKSTSMRGISTKFPLIEWGWSDKDCLNYCYERGFDWEGLYEYFGRVSCWCCPFQGIKELRNLRKHFLDLWQRLLDMQKKSWNAFRMDGKTVFDLDTRFKEEDKQLYLFPIIET